MLCAIKMAAGQKTLLSMKKAGSISLSGIFWVIKSRLDPHRQIQTELFFELFPQNFPFRQTDLLKNQALHCVIRNFWMAQCPAQRLCRLSWGNWGYKSSPCPRKSLQCLYLSETEQLYVHEP